MDIFIQFAVAAAQFAMDDAKLAISPELAPRVGVFIGSGIGGSYWCVGCYFAGGVSCPIVAEIAYHDFFSPRDLSARISRPPAWPVA